MIVNHNIYGKVKIKEPVLVELIKSKPLQRLKKINQGGTQLVETELEDMTRYNHCVGVMILLKNYDASLEEQVAGLLHDVPHTAFSHMIDFALGKAHQQTFHEDHKERIIMESEIPKILEKYKISLRRVLDEKNFPFQEREIPALCADRIDYFFMDIYAAPKGFHKPNYFLNHLRTHKDEFVLDNQKVAREFAAEFMKKCLNRWNGLKTLVAFSLLAEAVRISMAEGLITDDDILQDDEYLLDILPF